MAFHTPQRAQAGCGSHPKPGFTLWPTKIHALNKPLARVRQAQAAIKLIEKHHAKHIHVRYTGHNASIAIDDGRVLAGELPTKQLKMVQAWIEIHKDELFADWELAANGEQPFRVAPLQ